MAPTDSPSPLPLMGLATSFWQFKTLASAYELGLFARLSGTAGVTAAELAADLGIEERPAEMLLTGCTALGLLDKRDGRYGNSAMSEEYLVPGKPSHLGGLITMFDQRLYAGWDKLTTAIRTNRPTTWDPDRERSLFESADPRMLEVFWEAMHAMSTQTARTLASHVDLSRYHRLLDVGGGSAAFDIELTLAYPQLRANVYELAFVAEIAEHNIKAAGATERVGTISGDFFTDEAFPGGHDLHLFSMVMHDWDEARNRVLLRKSFEALEPGGAVVLCELLVDDDKTGPLPAAMMSLNKLVETEGRNYTVAEYAAWLTDVGFAEPEVVAFDAVGANGVVIAHKR
ncbi:putative O-methyltransferase YrrM [Actinokineospora baliensis]|uniref:methyltransferase n=1 Tax=Actinokineospora baliensis TaxID=547056 RepID=UPI0019570A35|nr:methyltransferase [Actinokineospora baliensis]MBM7773192.1 putative O-methyltransferase YrrM [Actinokineospora baliensis]